MRLEWSEVRDGDTVFVIAEPTSDGWIFFERSTWEVTWWPASATADRIARTGTKPVKPTARGHSLSAPLGEVCV